MKGKHVQKKFGAVGAMAPTPLSLETRGRGGDGGGGLGGVAYKDRAWPPPPPPLRAPSGCVSHSAFRWSSSQE